MIKIIVRLASQSLFKAFKKADVTYLRDVFLSVGHRTGLANGTNAEKWFNNASDLLRKRNNCLISSKHEQTGPPSRLLRRINPSFSFLFKCVTKTIKMFHTNR